VVYWHQPPDIIILSELYSEIQNLQHT